MLSLVRHLQVARCHLAGGRDQEGHHQLLQTVLLQGRQTLLHETLLPSAALPTEVAGDQARRLLPLLLETSSFEPAGARGQVLLPRETLLRRSKLRAQPVHHLLLLHVEDGHVQLGAGVQGCWRAPNVHAQRDGLRARGLVEGGQVHQLLLQAGQGRLQSGKVSGLSAWKSTSAKSRLVFFLHKALMFWRYCGFTIL